MLGVLSGDGQKWAKLAESRSAPRRDGEAESAGESERGRRMMSEGCADVHREMPGSNNMENGKEI